jgi:hypothetical protein
MTAPHINQLRDHLMQTLAALRDRENPMEPDRARAVAQVASVLVDTAKVEVDYLKATGQDKSAFLEEPTTTSLPTGTGSPFPQGITGITQHRLQG